MKRLFIAIHFQAAPELSELLENLARKLKHERINWVQPGNLHLTLKFIGETADERINDIVTVMQQAADNQNKFAFNLDKIGIFGSSYNPRVLWIGSMETVPQMLVLANTILDGCDAIGFPRDRQNFVPHLTLGRIKGLNDKKFFQQVMQKIPQQHFQQSEVNEIRLYESILRKEGPIYVVQKTVMLKDLKI